ncbi:MAG: putative metal-binding motif-containing protein [Deltaproteobacteria bacterium]|nr:putative metal-binding motif-containing protein [Deltaproteobacteria bacterium]
MQRNVFYNAGAQTDTRLIGESVYTVTDGKAVKLAYNETDERWGVSGHYDAGYRAFDAHGTKLAYSDNDALIGVMGDTGVELFDVGADGVVSNTDQTGCVASDLRKPVLMKSLGGVIYCGMEEKVAVNEAVLEFATTVEKDDERRHKRIKIIAPEDGLQLVKVLGFDSREIDGVPWTVVAFSDGKDVRIRAIEDDGFHLLTSGVRLGGNVWKSNADIDLKDISFYHGQKDETEDSQFAILDSKNNKVWLGKVDANVDTGNVDTDDAKSINVGANPQAMQFSEKSGNLYVLNRGDKNISVIPLMSDTKTAIKEPKVTKTIDIAASVPGKTIDFAPNSFAMNNKELFVADETTKALILVDLTEQEIALPEYQKPEPEEPTITDVDQDGFDSNVDCNDNDATINPNAVEICGDSIDQNCDGVDEECPTTRGGR